jgi:phosphoribosyl 1,2-cyclic phosphodiesterase
MNDGLSFKVLGSSSSGNSTLITCGERSILIDAGLPLSYVQDMVPERIEGIFVSHEHVDHVRCLKPIAKALTAPVYLSSPVEFCLRLDQDIVTEKLSDGRPIRVGPFTVIPFLVSHDALEPYGFVVEAEGRSLGIVTDLGWVQEEVVDRLRGRDALIVESNYDRDMLMRGPYPQGLKTRIMKEKGHLSNVQCRDLIERTIGSRTKEVVLAHLSEENNDPLLAMEASLPALRTWEGSTLRLSYPRHPTPLLRLD